MQWIVLAAALELGWMPMGDFVMHEPQGWASTTGSFYVEMDARVVICDILFVGGEVKTLMYKTPDGYSFWPERMVYEFSAGVTFGPAEIGWRHMCTHPIIPYLREWPGLARWEGAYEEVYLRVDTTSKK